MADAKKVAGMTSLDLGHYQGKDFFVKNINEGVLAKISGQLPELKLGATDFFVFDTAGGVELVGENAQKSGSEHGITKATAKTYKVQKTVRISNELEMYDEDEQARIIDNLAAALVKDISRSLDLLAIHGINPKTGQQSELVTNYLLKSGSGVKVVDTTADAEADIVKAAGELMSAGKMASAVAFDPKFVGELAKVKDGDGRQKYPELGLGFKVENFQQLPAVASDTVSARREMKDKAAVSAIIGDFENQFKWGIAKDVKLEMIRYGDPDGEGDLARNNQVAIRAEAYIGFVFGDPESFAVVKKAGL